MTAEPSAFPDVRPFAELSRGPVASVFKAYDATAGEVVLLKALRPAADPERRARFADEARLAATVDHPNVVRVRRVASDGAALVADWVEGGDLGALLAAEGALPPALAAFVAAEAARGLAAVHAAGILHRDVKPANVLVGADGSVRLTDFGLASLADGAGHGTPGGSPEVRGTLATLAPEIVRGDAAGPASDVFSLGAVLAHALTGHAPFAAPTASGTLDAVLHVDAAARLAADPRIPAAMATVAAGALDRAPEARPSARALSDRLAALAGEVGA
ncbi:MAG TPA: serine/threonine-protein kinase, partial [Rubricoccaceae bacterium]